MFAFFFQSVYDSFDPYNKTGDQQQPSSLTPAKSTDFVSPGMGNQQPSSLQPHHTPSAAGGGMASTGSPARVNGNGYQDRYSMPPPFAGENSSAIANNSGLNHAR